MDLQELLADVENADWSGVSEYLESHKSDIEGLSEDDVKTLQQAVDNADGGDSEKAEGLVSIKYGCCCCCCP